MMERTNLLFILTDDQGYWAMGCAGNSELRTPNLDRLAETGVRFTNFFCASPVCSPARASILTGRIPSQHGVQDFLRRGNTNLTGAEDRGIEYLAGQTAYTDLLAEAGYVCGLSGKWHLGYSELPQKSFSYWHVHASGSGPYFDAPMIDDGVLYTGDGYVSDLIADNALAFLKSQKGNSQPFCLNVNFTAPHAPWGREHHPPELFEDYFQNCRFQSTPDEPMHPKHLHKDGAAGSLGFTPESRRESLAGYFAATTALDTNVGRLLDWLEENGLRENTLVIFTSDNGMNMGHHGIYGKGNGTFPPNMFDTSVKVPTIISLPGTISGNRVVDALLSHYDLMPTLLDCLGVENLEASNLPGESFASLLRSDSRRSDNHVCVLDEYGPTRMIRTSSWKYIHRYPFGPNELYDLAEDPDERTNLIDQSAHLDIQTELRASLEAWFVRYADPQKDGTREAVMGRGQLNIVGPAADGAKRFADDIVYHLDYLG